MFSSEDLKELNDGIGKDMVNHPDHYGGKDNPFEVVKVTEAWGKDFGLSHNLCSAVEYIARCNRKGTKEQDLEKAIWRIKREIGGTYHGEAKSGE